MRIPRNKRELLEALYEKAKDTAEKGTLMHDGESILMLALGYLINDICPDDRTTKHVFRNRRRLLNGY